MFFVEFYYEIRVLSLFVLILIQFAIIFDLSFKITSVMRVIFFMFSLFRPMGQSG